MKLATFRVKDTNRESFGLVMSDGIADLPALGLPWRSALEFLQAGPDAWQAADAKAKAAKPTLQLSQVQLLTPVPNAPKVIGLAVNYVEHHREFNRGHDLPDDPSRHTTPRPFIMPQTALAGPGDEIPWPDFSRQIDHEIELAVVIGKPCRRVSPAQAKDYIFGYTIANDISARSVTHSEGRTVRPKDDFFDWLHGKWADAFCPTGPWIVSADEIGDVQNLELELTVNGQTRQKANTSLMIFDVFKTVSFISHIMTLLPGDIIATGTPSGVGMATGKLLAGGDEITCRIEKVGELTNRLGQPPAEFYAPCK